MACTPQPVLALPRPPQTFMFSARALWACGFLWLKVFPLHFLWHNKGLVVPSLLQRWGPRARGLFLNLSVRSPDPSSPPLLSDASVPCCYLETLCKYSFFPVKIMGFSWRDLEMQIFRKTFLTFKFFFFNFCPSFAFLNAFSCFNIFVVFVVYTYLSSVLMQETGQKSAKCFRIGFV